MGTGGMLMGPRHGMRMDLVLRRPAVERDECGLQSKHPLQTIAGHIRERRWSQSTGLDIELREHKDCRENLERK